MFKFLKEKIGAFIKKPKEEEKSETPIKKTEKKTKKPEKISSEKQKNSKSLKKEKGNIKTSKTKLEDKTKDIIKTEERFLSKLFKKKKIKDVKEKKTEDVKKEVIQIRESQIKEKSSDRIKEPENKSFFSKLINKISSQKLSREDFEEIFSEFEITLLENNVALEAVDKIKESLSSDLIEKEIKKSEASEKVLEALKNSIFNILTEPPNFLEPIKKSQGIYTILFFGINGTGKTTSIAKIASLLKKNNISCCLAAADTFRAASIEQLKIHGDKLNIPVISSDYGSDPASVAFDAKKYAQTHNIKVVLIDTAGRMYTKDNLLREMEKIIRISQPNLKIFVGESITGNDAIDQARTFNETAGIDGIILSKADIDEKAGTILSVSYVTKKPIYFLGTGQEYKDLIIFSKKEVLKNLGLE